MSSTGEGNHARSPSPSKVSDVEGADQPEISYTNTFKDGYEVRASGRKDTTTESFMKTMKRM